MGHHSQLASDLAHRYARSGAPDTEPKCVSVRVDKRCEAPFATLRDLDRDIVQVCYKQNVKIYAITRLVVIKHS